ARPAKAQSRSVEGWRPRPSTWRRWDCSRLSSLVAATSPSERSADDDVCRCGPVAEAGVDASHAGVRLVVRREDLLDPGCACACHLLALERGRDSTPPPRTAD